MRANVVGLVLLFSSPAIAENKFLELQLSPSLGYSNFSGFHLGLDSSLSFSLSDRWQWKVGASGAAMNNQYENTFTLSTGAVYNFSDDRSQSFFVGAGASYGNARPHRDYYDDSDNRSFLGYVEAGKRFKLNESGSFTWTPTATWYYGSGESDSIIPVISPLNFSYSF